MPNDQATPPAAPAEAQKRQLVPVHDDGEFGMLMDTSKFAQLQRIGTMYARSKMVPAHFQGDEPSCMVAVQMAMRLNIDPFMFLQKTYVVGGKPGMEAPLVIALINTRGPFVGPIDWNLKKDDKGDVVECTAFATHRTTGRVCQSTVTWKMVEAEGWSKKTGSKWLTLREQMFKYRSAAFLGRLYCPEVLMGMATADELQDQEIDVTPADERPEAAAPRRATLRERVTAQAIDVTAGSGEVGEPLPSQGASAPSQPTLAEMNIEIHDEEPRPAAQGPAGSPAAPAGGTPTPKGAPMPYEDVLRLAKRAKTPAQGEIVLDVLNDKSYTDEQRAEVKVILNSKDYAATAEK